MAQVEPVPPGQVDRLVRARLRRQDILDREVPPRLSVVLDESVLRRRVGDDAVMRAQLAQLARDAARPDVALQILPLDTPHRLVSESFEIFSFGPDTAAIGDVVSAGHLTSSHHVDGERDTYLHQRAFAVLAAAALEPGSSRARIDDTARSRWSARA